jgi:MoaA/NifB/PqqE/SkfB family radical SAM enzyme
MFLPLLGCVPAGHLWYLFRKMRNENPHCFAGGVRINTFFPPWPSPAFDRFCANVAARRRVPYSVYLAASAACPFHCPHCSYGGRSRAALPTERLLKLIAEIKALGACTLGLTGGEPLLRPDLEELIAAAGPELATIVFTTGHSLDHRRAASLRQAGTTCVTVGLESADPAAHDAVRGVSGSFAEARAAIAACREVGLYTAISTVGFREKIASGELDRLYALGKDWGVGEFRLLAPVATGSLAGCGAAMLTPDELRALSDFHVLHNRRRTGPAVNSFAYLESDALFGCGAGYHHLFIDADGEVCPCDLSPMSFGNVAQEPLAAIWQRLAEFFPRPRCGCLMGKLAGKFPAGSPLPLPREHSESLCPRCAATEPLPEGYRRLLDDSSKFQKQ